MIERLIDFSLRNRLLMIVLTAMIVGAGAWTYRWLPVDAVPDVSPTLVQVFTLTEGLAPTDVEQYVTYPVESAMTGLPDVTEIRSISNFGLSVVSVYFEDGTDIYFARQLVGERVLEAQEQIPEGFGEPAMGPISTGMGLILYYHLQDTTGDYSLTELRTLQDWLIKRQLQTVPGVTEVLGIGGYEKQYQVRVNPQALLRYDLTLGEVIDRVEANNLTVGAQYLELNSEQFVIRSAGLAQGVEDLESIVIKSVDGQAIYLRDVARIQIGGAIRQGLQVRNSEGEGDGEVVAAQVVQLYGANTSQVIEDVEKKLDQIRQTLPEGVEIIPYYEQKTLVDASVHTVTRALLEGVVLVVLVLLVFMGGLRASVVVALALPFSVLFAVIAMGQFAISANLMSLGGLAIAIGMMVDGAVVMVENVDRHLREAPPAEPRTSIVGRACREVGQPIVFAIAIIIIVFLPLFTLEGVAGKTFRPLAYTVALAMTGSLFYAILQAPVFSDLLMRRPKSEQHHEPWLLRKLLVFYQPLVRFFVRRRWAAVLLAVALLAVGGSIFPQLGSEFTPTLNEGTLVVRLTMAPSIALSESKQTALIAGDRLTEIPEVKEVVSRVGRGEVGAHADPINSAEMYVLLKPENQWREGFTQEDIASAVREKMSDMPGVMMNLTQPIQLTVDELVGGVKAELAIKLYGEDLDVLKTKADEIAALVREIPGAADVQVDQISGAPQLLIRPSREAIARYGINIADVQQVIRAAVGGTEAGQIFEGIPRFDIYARYQPEARSTPEAIGEILIEAPGGQRVPLSQLATIETIVGPRQITRENAQRFIAVQNNVVGRDIGSFVAEAQRIIDREVELPTGYLIDWGGQFELQQEANARLAVVVPITLALVCLLLYSSFGSLGNALLILLNIPLALVGGIVALWLSGLNLSVPASVGFIALFGVAVLNGVVLVAYLNQLLREGLPIEEVSVRGACLRLRPVLITASVAILGLVPLLFSAGTGSEVQRPLAAVVVGGLVTSTTLTLLVLPALYKWFAISIERERSAEAPAAAAPSGA
ncbi:MAG: efflux RND transporter permease subunit [Gammaproteobacteria bacterium]